MPSSSQDSLNLFESAQAEATVIRTNKQLMKKRKIADEPECIIIEVAHSFIVIPDPLNQKRKYKIASLKNTNPPNNFRNAAYKYADTLIFDETTKNRRIVVSESRSGKLQCLLVD